MDRTDRRRLGPAIAALSVLATLAPIAVGQTYTIVDLGTLGGPSSEANGVSPGGVAVGGSRLSTANFDAHAFSWSGALVGLGAPVGGTNAWATAINDSGEISGVTSPHGVTPMTGWVHDGVGPLLLAPLPGHTSTSAEDVNANGDAVGSSWLPLTSFTSPVRWPAGSSTPIDLGTPLGSTTAEAAAINSLGTVVGQGFTAGSQWHAMLWDSSGLQDLGTLGGTWSNATDVNDVDQVIGESSTAAGSTRHAFLWEAGVMTDLGTLAPGQDTYPQAINLHGDWVGWARDAAGDPVAVWGDGSQIVDLNDRLPTGSGWRLTVAMDVNDAGQIVGQGEIGGEFHAFLMTPVSEECAPPPSGMIAWYKADDCGPSDFLGNHSGTFVGAPICPLDWKVGGGALAAFDGPPTYVIVPHSPALDPGFDEMTVDAWVQTEARGLRPIAEKRAGSGWALSLRDGRVRFEVCDTSICAVAESFSVVNDGTFHFVAATLERAGEGRALNVWVDGDLEATAVIDTLGDVSSSADLTLGSDSAAFPKSFLEGVIDELEIFDRALDAAEIESIVAAGSAGKCTDVCTPPPAEMVAWWDLDETTESIAADRILANDGTHVGCPSPVDGRVEAALSFDGIDDGVEVPTAPELNFGFGDLTIDAWMRTTAEQGIQSIVDKREGPIDAAVGYTLFLSDGTLWAQLSDGGSTNYGSPAFVADGEWHHVAVTVDRDDPQGLRLYVDGGVVATHDPTGRAGDLTNRADVWLGKRHPISTVLYFEGEIDEVELFSRALAPDEVNAIAAAGSAGKCKERPTEALTLTQGVLQHGSAVTFQVTGALPSETVLFARGSSTGCGPCIPALGGLCVDLLGPSLIGTATADATGTASLTITIPTVVPPGDVSTQAAIIRGPGGSSSVKSNTVTAPVLP